MKTLLIHEFVICQLLAGARIFFMVEKSSAFEKSREVVLLLSINMPPNMVFSCQAQNNWYLTQSLIYKRRTVLYTTLPFVFVLLKVDVKQLLFVLFPLNSSGTLIEGGVRTEFDPHFLIHSHLCRWQQIRRNIKWFLWRKSNRHQCRK